MFLEELVWEYGNFRSYDPGVYEYWGSRETFEWAWAEAIMSGSGISYGAGVDNRYEFTIFRNKLLDFGVKLSDTFTVGVQYSDSAWNVIGSLPNVASTDDNYDGIAPMLEVNTNR